MLDQEYEDYLKSIDECEENDRTRKWLEKQGLSFDETATDISDYDPE